MASNIRAISTGYKVKQSSTNVPCKINYDNSCTATFDCGFTPVFLMAYQIKFNCMVYNGSSVTIYKYYGDDDSNSTTSGTVTSYSTGIKVYFSKRPAFGTSYEAQTMLTDIWIAYG